MVNEKIKELLNKLNMEGENEFELEEKEGMLRVVLPFTPWVNEDALLDYLTWSTTKPKRNLQ